MKLVNRQTRKAIEKSVRKAMKKHGPALMASLASALASSIATLAKTEATGRAGKSNLAVSVERGEESVIRPAKKRARTSRKERPHRKQIASDVGAKE